MRLLIVTIKNWQPPSKIEISQILQKHNISVKKAAHMARIGERTFKEWLDLENPKMPSQAAWSMFQSELRAMKMGFKNLEHLFIVMEEQYG